MADNKVELLIKLQGDQAALQALRDIQNLTNGLNGKNININFGGATTQAYSLRDAIAAVGNTISSIGSGINIVGGTLTSLGDMFGGDILAVAGRTLISKATSLVTQGISNSISRFDTFRTFPKLLELMGFGAEDAQAALDKLNESVLGLPTSLDEMAEMSKNFIMFYGDIEKGTDLAIAANNAFLANASDATQVTFGLRQIRDILSRGGLRELEWESLLGALGTSLGPIGEEFGYTADQIGEFREALKTGDIDAMDFIDALIRVGGPGGVLAERANLLKDTLNAATTNIRIAFANLGASVLQELDASLTDNTGRSLVEHIVDVSDAIKQKLIPAIREWIQEHPDDVVGFFESLGNFDWLKLLSSLGQGAYKYFTGLRDIFRWLVDTFGEDNVIKFITFATIFASPLGRALQLISRPISLIGQVITSLSRLSVGGLFFRMGRKNVIVQLAQTFADVFKILAGAAGFVGIIYLFGQVVREYIGIAEEIGRANFGNLSGNLPILGDLIVNIGMIVGGLVTLFSAINALGGGKATLLGEAETAVFLGLISFTGMIMDQLTDLMVKIGGVDFGNYKANMQAVSDLFNILFAETGFLVTLTSFLSVIPGGGIAMGIGEAVVGGLLAEVDYVIHIISRLVDLIGDISKVKIPSDAKINDVGHVIGEITKIFKNTSFDTNLSLGHIINMSILALGLSAFYNVIDAFDKITKKEINTDAIVDKLGVLQEIVEALNKVGGSITSDGELLEAIESDIINKMRVGILASYMLFLAEFYAIIWEIQHVNPEEAGAFGTSDDPFSKKMAELDEITDGLNDMAAHVGATSGIVENLCLLIEDTLKVGILRNYRRMLSTYADIIAELAELDPRKAGAYGMDGNPFIDLTSDDTRIHWDDPLTLKMEQLKEIGQELQDLATSLSGEANNWQLLKANINVLLTAGLLASYNEILEEFDTVINTIMGIDPTKAGAYGNGQPFIDLTEGNGEVTTIWSDPFTEKMGQLTEIGVQLKDLANDISDFDSWWGGISEVIQAHCQNVILALQGDEIQLIQDLAVAISELDLSMVEGLDDDKSIDFNKKMTTIRNMLIGMSNALQPLDSYWGPLGTAIASWNQFWMGEKLENMVKSVGNLDDFLKNMKTALGDHSWIQDVTEDQFDEFIANATKAVERMDELLHSENLKRLWSMVDGNNEITYESFSTALAGYNSIIEGIRDFIMMMDTGEINPAETVESFTSAIQKIGDLIFEVNTMQGLMEGFTDEEGSGNKLGYILQTLVGTLGGEDAAEAAELVSGFAELIPIIQQSIAEMSETDLSDLNEALAILVECVQTLNDPELPNLQEQTNSAATEIDALKVIVNDTNQAMQVLIGTVWDLSTAMYDASVSAISLANAINEIPDSKTITISVDSSDAHDFFEAPGVTPFIGGAVPKLLASGGRVDWRPRGTDSVPALLTPGEYVLNRSAASAIGRDVLDRLNSMNIPNAIDALMSRVNLPMSASVVANDNRRYTDNHAQVIQNINTNNAAFTYRRASRFVGAL